MLPKNAQQDDARFHLAAPDQELALGAQADRLVWRQGVFSACAVNLFVYSSALSRSSFHRKTDIAQSSAMHNSIG